VRWLHGVTGGQTMGRGISPVVANTDVNYRRPIVWPNDIVVELFVERLGNSSVTIGHRIVADNDDTVLYSDGHVVVVWIDTATGKSAPIPEAVRQASV
jgi:acyl-CoA thioester hydrolase